MSSPIAVSIAASDGPYSQLRLGTVTSSSTATATVLVGGTQVQAGYLTSYTPAQGDLVAILRQDATWLILGQPAGVGPNQIQNPSFELSPPGTVPTFWQFADITNLSQVVVADRLTPPDGTQYAQVISEAATSQSYLYSSPIAVEAGQIYNVGAYVTGIYDVDAPQTADAAIFGLWFADQDDLYPTTISADTSIVTLNDVPSGPPFIQISGNVTVPVSGFMRIALRSTMAVGQSLGWDFVTARRTS